MTARRRRTPIGTQPPSELSSAQRSEVAGTIWAETEPVAKHDGAGDELAVPFSDQEHTVIVQVDDEWLAWLARLESLD